MNMYSITKRATIIVDIHYVKIIFIDFCNIASLIKRKAIGNVQFFYLIMKTIYVVYGLRLTRYLQYKKVIN